jgi:HK97 family phage portal protein
MKMYYPIFKQFSIEVEGNRYEPYEFLKILRNTKDGASGVGITVEVSKALETAYQTLLYQLGLVKKGGNKRGFLKSQRKLGQDEIDILKTAWANLYSNNEESVVVLNNGLEFQEASNTSVEMQLNESKKAFIDEINAIFHIYPDDFDRKFKEAIYPIVKAFETALNRDLLLEKEKNDYFFVFDVKEIIKASIKERYEAYKTAKETGFLTINEIRAEENLNYVEGLDVVNVGLGAVLYDINTHTYYTPNMNQQTDLNKTDAMLEAHVMEQEFVADGNSSDA